MKTKLHSDFTAVYKDENGTHILKAKIKDKETFYIQFFNKTKNTDIEITNHSLFNLLQNGIQ